MKTFFSIKRTVLIASLLALTILLCACGAKTDGADTSANKTETEHLAPATEATEDTTAADDTGSLISDEKIYADIWEQTAIEEAISRIGEDYKCVGTEKGETPDGAEAWIVSLTKIDGSDEAVWKCYVSGMFCYLEDGAPDPLDNGGADIPDDKIYADIWEQTAIEEAISRIGSDYKCVGTEKGEAPDGMAAWIVSLTKIDGSDETVWKCYVSGKFCYLEDGAPDPIVKN